MTIAETVNQTLYSLRGKLRESPQDLAAIETLCRNANTALARGWERQGLYIAATVIPAILHDSPLDSNESHLEDYLMAYLGQSPLPFTHVAIHQSWNSENGYGLEFVYNPQNKGIDCRLTVMEKPAENAELGDIQIPSIIVLALHQIGSFSTVKTNSPETLFYRI